MTTAELPLADTRDMLSIHQVFRDMTSSGPRWIEPVADGDTTRSAFVGTYYRATLATLHAHHEGEDELLTPRLLERRPDQAPVIDRVMAMHEAVSGDLEAAEQALEAWAATAAPEDRAAALQALAQLDGTLGEHLAAEETDILPIAASCINVAEWGELPAHAMQHTPKDVLWLVIGLVREQMPPEAAAQMLLTMPPPVADFWLNVGERMFTDYVTQLRG